MKGDGILKEKDELVSATEERLAFIRTSCSHQGPICVFPLAYTYSGKQT